MVENDNSRYRGEVSRVLVEFDSVESMDNTIRPSSESEEKDEDEIIYPELQPVFDAIGDAYHGLRKATQEDERGRMRNVVQEHADKEDMVDWRFGHHLRVLETHGLAVQDGKRWRVSEVED